MRLGVSFILGSIAAFFLFLGMQWMISPGDIAFDRTDEIAMVGFIRSMQDTQTQQKNRSPQEPKEPKIVPLASPAAVALTAPTLAVSQQPIMSASLASFKGDGIIGIMSGYGYADSDVTPLVQVEPSYPAQALSRKIEGYVVIEFTINSMGEVTDIAVVDADPKGVFEREAIKAAWRYRFKPKIIDGKPSPQKAILPFEFKLGG